MPFSWYEADVPDDFLNSPDKAVQMYEAELRERSALLMRLGYSKDAVLERIRGNVGWDFELHPAPVHASSVEAIVEQVFTHGGATGGGAPSLGD